MPAGEKTPNKGYAVIHFKSRDSALAALKKAETFLEGRPLLIRLSATKASEQTPAAAEATRKRIAECQGDEVCHSVWVGNLSFRTREESIVQFLSQAGEVININVPRGLSGSNNRGYAFAEYATAEEVEKAVALSESALDGRNLLIKKDGTPLRGSGPQQSQRAAKVPRTKNESPALHPPEKSCFVGNLSFNTTENSLQVAFGECDIFRIRLATFEDTGRCKGYAHIDFNDEKSAQHAVDLSPVVNGRKTRVEISSGQNKARQTTA